jgi:hypothetical protein
MYRGSGPRILPLIIVILVVALVIAALVSIGRVIFTSGNTSSAPESTDAVLSAVRNTGVDRSVRWTVRGPIVADEDFRSYQITVSPTERTYVTYSGYLDHVNDTKTYPNNERAYEEFVYALDKAGIGQTKNAKDTDFRGVCATDGFAYVFDTLSGNTADHTLWTTSCKGSKGSMAANVAQVHALFVNQIPDFNPLFTGTY